MTAKDLDTLNLKTRILQLDELALSITEIGRMAGVSCQYVSYTLIKAGRRRQAKIRSDKNKPQPADISVSV